MNRKFTPEFALVAILLFSFQVSTMNAQVGINTTTPAAGSILDVEATDKAMLIPRIDIADLTTIAPVTGGATTSLLAYNTNTTTGPGFFYWNGSIWVGIDGDRDWKLEGNSNTNPGTTDGDDFLGTRDNNELIIATNQTPALTIGTNQRIRANNLGSQTAPTYTFTGDTNTGIYRGTVDQLDIVAGAREMAAFNENGNNSEVIINDNGDQTDFRVEGDTDANTLVVDAATDDVGIGTNAPNARLEVKQNATTNELPITRFTSGDDRSLDILQPVNGNANDPFTFATNNALEFRVDAVDAMTIDSDGEVGVDQTNPQTSLHVGGTGNTVRVDALNSTNNTFNNGIDNSVVYADANGNLVLQDRVDDFPVDASDSSTFFSSPVVITDATGTVLSGVVHTETITLTRETLIEVCFWTSVNVQAFGGTLITDGKPRIFGAYVTDGLTDIVYNASSYTNGILSNDGYLNTGNVTTGFFTVGGNGFINLPAGTHTISMIIFAGGGEAVTLDETSTPRAPEGYEVTFGANAFNRFQIVYHN